MPYCGQCGAPLGAGAKFCTQCGASAPINEPIGETNAFQPESPQPKKRRWLPWTIAAIVCVIVIGVGIGVFLWWQNDQKAHELHPISFEIQIANYDPSQSTKIPIHITGTDLDKQSVDQIAFVDVDGPDVELLQGEYTIEFPASPLSADGTLWAAPTTRYVVIVDDALESGYHVEMSDGVSTFEVLEPLKITDEQITTAYEYAIKDESQSSVAATYQDATMKAREVAQKAEQERLEAERKAREEEERAKQMAAALHVETPFYSFDLPEEWYGKVTVIHDGDNVNVVYKDDPQVSLVRTIVNAADTEEVRGDIGNSWIADANLPDGRRVEFWILRYAAIVNMDYFHGSPRHDQNIDEEILQLQTGGRVSLNEAIASSQVAFETDEYIRDTIVSTLKVF